MSLLSEKDFPEVFEMFEEPDIFQYICPDEIRTSETNTEFLNLKLTEIATGKWFYWLLRSSSDNSLIGAINVTPIPGTDETQIGWMIRKRFQKQGFAYEAAQKTMEFILNKTNHSLIYSVYDIENIASEKIIEKLGFTYHKSFSEGSNRLNKYVFRVAGP